MIKARGLTKRYHDFNAIESLSFDLKAGEIVGLLGPNGAGKTTAMRVLTGYLPATSGQVQVAGYDVQKQPWEVRRRIGYVPEIPPLYPDLTVAEYLRFIGTLKGLAGKALCEELQRTSAVAGVTKVGGRLIRNISRGYRQRTAIAQALLGDPAVLILDEPTSGLDPRQIGEVRSLCRELAGSHTVLISTHILQEAVATCDRVLIINQGRLVADHLVSGVDSGSLERTFLTLTEV